MVKCQSKVSKFCEVDIDKDKVKYFNQVICCETCYNKLKRDKIELSFDEEANEYDKMSN
jgi:hypothetical protein